MSKLLKEPKNTEKRKILQNINLFVGIHDITCLCNEPLKCIIKQIYNQEPTLQLNKEDFPQWFTTGETTVARTGEEDIDGDELDALFENLEDEDAKG